MEWVVCIRNLEDKKMVLIQDEKPDVDDPRWSDEAHIVPVSDHPLMPGYITFGIHDFIRDCACHPKIQDQVYGRTLIVHRTEVH
jgi:hypothetical protein